MKITDDTEVTFDWNGQEYTAYGTPGIDVVNEDIGPCSYGENFHADVVDKVTMSNIEILLNGELVKDPAKELFDKADDFLCCKAAEDFDAGR
jgi:hypothetical protein